MNVQTHESHGSFAEIVTHSPKPSPAESENLRIRAMLMGRLQKMVTARRLTQVQAARWFQVSQPRVSHLMQNQVNRFSTDTLINMLAHAGVSLSLDFEDSSA
jgi:predicted XRE-type DNA-binding protein